MPTYYLRPNSDVKADWTEDPAGTAWSVLDEAVTQPTAPTTGSDRITVAASGKFSKHGLTTVTLNPREVVASATAWAYGKAVDASSYWSLNIVSGGNAIAGATQKSSSFGWASTTYGGALTQSELDALELWLISTGTGTVEVDALYLELQTTITAPAQVIRPELRLDLTNVITTPSGKRYRWAEDDPDPAMVPNGGSFSSTMPGGFEQRDVTLPRQSQTDYDDLERLSDWTVYGAGGEVAWQGRLESAPRASGDQMAASPGAVGWQAHLEDDKSARMIYRDTDLGNWTGQSAERQVAIDTSTIRGYGDGEVVWNALVRASLAQIQEGGWAANQGPYIENWYDAGEGALIAEIYAKWSRSYLTTSTDWDWRIGSGDDADGSTLVHSGDLQAEPSASGEYTYTLATASRYGVLRTLWNATTAAGSDNSRFGVLWHDVAVYGNHGLTKRGTEPDAGFYASDIIKHAVQTWAPLLRADDESVTDSGYILPQAAYRDPTTAAEIIRDANRIHLWDWAVWEGRRFYYQPQGSGRSWRARTGPSQLNETGPQIDRLWNGVIVSYQDVDGTTKMVGPPGAAAGATSTDLIDDDPENPANLLGLRRWDMLSLSGASTLAAATEVGRRFLEQTKQLDHSGSAQITGIVEDGHGVRYPAYMVRAGDQISFIDASDPSPRRIVKSSYDEGTRTCSIDLDAPPQGLEALLERLGAVLVPLGVS